MCGPKCVCKHMCARKRKPPPHSQARLPNVAWQLWGPDRSMLYAGFMLCVAVTQSWLGMPFDPFWPVPRLSKSTSSGPERGKGSAPGQSCSDGGQPCSLSVGSGEGADEWVGGGRARLTS